MIKIQWSVRDRPQLMRQDRKVFLQSMSEVTFYLIKTRMIFICLTDWLTDWSAMSRQYFVCSVMSAGGIDSLILCRQRRGQKSPADCSTDPAVPAVPPVQSAEDGRLQPLRPAPAGQHRGGGPRHHQLLLHLHLRAGRFSHPDTPI